MKKKLLKIGLIGLLLVGSGSYIYAEGNKAYQDSSDGVAGASENYGYMPSGKGQNNLGENMPEGFGQAPQNGETYGNFQRGPRGAFNQGGQVEGQIPFENNGDNFFRQGDNFNGMSSSSNTINSASSPSEIVESDVQNTAKNLVVDESSATTIVMSNTNNQVEIDKEGTYIITGTCTDGNIKVKKNTTGVVLILKDLDLTSTTGASLSLNKNSEVKIVIEGEVKLTDNEDSSLEDVSQDFDGAAIKAKDGSNVYLTGDGNLIITGNAKNGIKVGNENNPSFVIDGDLTIDITATNDGINSGYDLTILSGTVNLSVGDDGLHADRILTLGDDTNGPTININKSKEGLEGTIVNMFNGVGNINSSDDAINAANSDNTYASEITYSINITGGTWVIKSNGDGLDSNGNINITGGSTDITSAANGGEAGLDYINSIYVADGTLNNNSGVAFDAGMGQMGNRGMMNNSNQMGPMGQRNMDNSTFGNGQLPSSGSQLPNEYSSNENFFSKVGSFFSNLFNK